MKHDFVVCKEVVLENAGFSIPILIKACQLELEYMKFRRVWFKGSMVYFIQASNLYKHYIITRVNNIFITTKLNNILSKTYETVDVE